MFFGSRGIIVEDVEGSLPPGCYGTSIFNPETFELSQISGVASEAYALSASC